MARVLTELEASRLRLKISQLEVAHKTGLSPQYICDVLNGRRRLSVKAAIKLGNFLELSPRDLLIKQLDDDLRRASA